MISILITAALLVQQGHAPVPVKARVEGRVINSVNGEAVPKATVILRTIDEEHGPSYADETDGDGRFSIRDIEPGEYAAFAERAGFGFRSTGAAGAPPPNIKVEKGASVRDVEIRLNPLGVIAGRVLDADGDPLRNATVAAMRRQYREGKKELRLVEQVQTNDAGEFRLFGLGAGTFYLRASRNHQGPQKPESVYAYYPGTGDEGSAMPIELRSGAQLRGFDVRLRSTILYSIHFTLPDAGTGEPHNYPAFLLNNQGFMHGRVALVSSSGITFAGVAPGSYEAVVLTSDGDKVSYARRSVEVTNSDVDGGALTFVTPGEITGTVRVEGGVISAFPKLQISLQPTQPVPLMGSGSTDVRPDGSFTLKNVVPGICEVVVNAAPGLYLKSVRAGDKLLPDRRVDVTAQTGPLTVVLGADAGQVEGSVQNAQGQPVVRARVNAIAYGDQLGRIDLSRFAFTDEKGEFKIKNVPPGDYKIFAWEDVPVGAPQDPDFRKPFEKQAVPVRMAQNGHEKVQLTAIPATATKSDDP